MATARSQGTPQSALHLRTQPYRDRARLWTEAADKWTDELLRELSRLAIENDRLEEANRSFAQELETTKAHLADARRRPAPETLMQESRAAIAALHQRVAELTEENDGWLEQLTRLEAQVAELQGALSQALAAEAAEPPEPCETGAEAASAPAAHPLVGVRFRSPEYGETVRVVRATGGGRLIYRVEASPRNRSGVGKQHVINEALLHNPSLWERLKG